MTGKVVFIRLSILLIFIFSVCSVSSLSRKNESKHPQQISQSSPKKEYDIPYSRYGIGGMPIVSTIEELTILKNIGYVVAYSKKHRIPLWCSYNLTETKFFHEYQRHSSWQIDPRVKNGPDPDDYMYLITRKHRGHLAPSFAMARSYGTIAMIESYYMTNASPMSSKLNSGIWARLEEKVFGAESSWANNDKEVWIICGPIFDDSNETIGNNIALPKEYFKILLRDKNNGILDETFEVLAFRFPESGASKNQSLSDFICSIDSIEEATSIDFFPELSKELQASFESEIAPDIWKH